MQNQPNIYNKKMLTGLMALLLAGGLLTGCEEKKSQQMQMPLPQVAVQTLKAEDISTNVELTGRTSAFVVAEVRPQVSGIIQKRMFTEGATVKAGQQLYQIDQALFKATYDSALANVKKAEAQYVTSKNLADRYKQIIKVNGVSKQEYDDAIAKFRQANADLAAARAAATTAKVNLDYTKVFSPVIGQAGISSVTEGALVTANQATPLVYVQQMNPMYVDITQSSVEYLRLKRNILSGAVSQKDKTVDVSIVLEDGEPYEHKATLMLYDETVDRSTGSITIRAKVDNPDGLLMPGMYVKAVLPEGVTHGAILIPQQAVQRNQKGEPTVFVINDKGIAEVRSFKSNRSHDGHWVVTTRSEADKAAGIGVESGERVVMEGSLKIRGGSQVTTTQYKKPELGSKAAARQSASGK